METVELRVHGVHGTSPGAMLGVADGEVGQVAGDGLTGIYRTKDGKVPLRELDGTSVSVEAYSWGALTSGVQGFFGWVKRALWLVLLPFALVNLAHWARLGLGTGTAQAQWGARAVRVSGLLLTVFFVVTPCVIAIDMGAWQCFRFGVPGCSALPDWLNFLGGLTPGSGSPWPRWCRWRSSRCSGCCRRPRSAATRASSPRSRRRLAGTRRDRPGAAPPPPVGRQRTDAAAAALPPLRRGRDGDRLHRHPPAACRLGQPHLLVGSRPRALADARAR